MSWLSDSRSMALQGVFHDDDSFGGLPALVLLPEAAPIVVPAAIEAGAALVLLAKVGELVWTSAVKRRWLSGSMDTWSPSSPAWQELTRNTSLELDRKGLRMGKGCAWIMSPQGLYMRFVQVMSDSLMSSLPSAGHAGMKAQISQASARAVQSAASATTSGPGAALFAPGASAGALVAGEALLLISTFIRELGAMDQTVDAHTQGAMQTFQQELTACFLSIKKSWPKQIIGGLARFFHVFIKAFRVLKSSGWHIGFATVMAAIGKVLDDVVFDRRAFDEAFDFLWETVGVEHPDGVLAAPARVPQADSTTSTASWSTNSGSARLLSSVDNRFYEVGEIPAGSYRIYWADPVSGGLSPVGNAVVEAREGEVYELRFTEPSADHPNGSISWEVAAVASFGGRTSIRSKRSRSRSSSKTSISSGGRSRSSRRGSSSSRRSSSSRGRSRSRSSSEGSSRRRSSGRSEGSSTEDSRPSLSSAVRTFNAEHKDYRYVEEVLRGDGFIEVIAARDRFEDAEENLPETWRGWAVEVYRFDD